jgi:hypothetical protein
LYNYFDVSGPKANWSLTETNFRPFVDPATHTPLYFDNLNGKISCEDNTIKATLHTNVISFEFSCTAPQKKELYF